MNSIKNKKSSPLHYSIYHGIICDHIYTNIMQYTKINARGVGTFRQGGGSIYILPFSLRENNP